MLFVVCFVGGFFWVMLRCRALENAVKVVTTSNLIAVLLLSLWLILLIVFIFSFVKRRINWVCVRFIPLKCCEPEENTFCGEHCFETCFSYWSYSVTFLLIHWRRPFLSSCQFSHWSSPPFKSYIRPKRCTAAFGSSVIICGCSRSIPRPVFQGRS